MNELDPDALVAQYLEKNARTSVLSVADRNPDQEAKLQQLARITGVPVDAVRADPAPIEQRARMSAIDWSGVVNNSPVVTRMLADPQKAALVYDDTANLSALERGLRFAGGAAAAGVQRGGAGYWGVAENAMDLLAPTLDFAAGTILPENPLRRVQAGFQKNRKAAEAAAKYNSPKATGNVEAGLASGIGSFAQNTLNLPLLFAGPAGVDAYLAAMTLPVYGEGYTKGKDAGMGTLPSMGLGASQAAIEYATEKIPALWLLKDLKAGTGLLKAMGHQALREIPGEQVATVLQDLNEWAVLHPEKPFSEYLKERPSAAAQTLVATLVGTGGQVSVMRGADMALNLAQGKERAAQMAQERGKLLTDLDGLAKASKVRERDTSTFQDFIKSASEDGPVQAVYLDPKVLMQSGLAEQVAAVSPSVREQMASALATGADVRIPVDEYATHIAGTELSQSLIEDLKTDTGGMTKREADKYLQTQVESLKAEFDSSMSKTVAAEMQRAGHDQVREEIKRQLTEAGRTHDSANEAYSLMVANFYNAMGAKLGESAADVYQRFPLRVRGPGQPGAGGGSVLDQVTPAQAAKLSTPVRMPQDAVFTAAVANTQGASVTPEGLTLNLVRHQKPEQEGELSVRTGVFYLPAGHPSQKHYKGKSGYGGAQKHEGPTTLRAPLFVKGATGGKAPQQAYDLLKGKGAYEALRSEYFSAVGFSKKGTALADAIGMFLDKHGGDADMAWNIVENSKEGNQMPYAVSEHLAAHAAREAGYDSIVGYSTGKAGPSIAEVFDLREVTYPSKVLPAQIHPTFEQSPQLPEALDIDGKARPTTNSKGQALASSEEGVRNFWRWFGDSKVVDAEGRPLVVYHGTGKDFAEFNTKGGPGKSHGAGAFFTPDPARASTYAPGRDGGAVMPVYLRLANPVEIDANGRNWDGIDKKAKVSTPKAVVPDADEALLAELEGRDPQREATKTLKARSASLQRFFPREFQYGDETFSTDDLARWANKQGYEGVAIHNVKDHGPSGTFSSDEARAPSTVWVAFSPNQIKSATGNNGQFSAQSANILEQQARGTYSPEQRTITLLKGADLSTFLHEAGHHFLEIQIEVAGQVAGKDPATLTEGERAMFKDTSTLLSWFGIGSIAEWSNLSFEEKRSYHEQFARGFEAYLVDGSSPSLELNRAFQKFRAWLLNVYKDIKRLVKDGATYRSATGKVLNVALSDDVRQVMDRMLATNEEILQAEQGRSMLPIFESAEQAGKTVQEWADYQSLADEATQEAVHDLETRGVRDMKWLQNAKSRKLKELQAQADDARADTRSRVRTEVMSQPVYRAWTFLTAKLTKDDKFKPPVARKSVRGPLDPAIDSLYVAIAKLGGLNKADAIQALGWDAKGKSPFPVFGTPLLRPDGGLTADQMAERLAEVGYLAKGMDGRHDMQEFEEKFQDESKGVLHYANQVDANQLGDMPQAGEDLNLEALGAGRLDLDSLFLEDIPKDIVATLTARGMTDKQGLNVEMLAEQFGFSSASEMTTALAEATPPEQEVEHLTDIAMLENHSELSSPEAIARAADRALHNDARARFVATELAALEKAAQAKDASGKMSKPTLAKAARVFAETLVARAKIRDVRPSLYANAASRASKQAAQALREKNIEVAAAEKRNQLVSTYATKAAHSAIDEIEAALKYLKRFENDGGRKSVDADYLDQIHAILERFDLRKGTTLANIDKQASLLKWLEEQEADGIEVDISEKVRNEALRQSYKELTVEEFRAMIDSVKAIEHVGRLKHRMLTALDKKSFEAIIAEMVASVEEHGQGKHVDNRTRDVDAPANLFKGFLAAHRKVSSLARELDGFNDGGSFWSRFVRGMNTAGDREASLRAETSAKLAAIIKPMMAEGKLSGKGKFFPTLGMSFNRAEVLAIALNTGNEGNLQRLLDGRQWTEAHVQPVLDTLSAADWQGVQAIWDLFESFRPLIAEKERRIFGKEPAWIEPREVTTKHGKLRGGYYPVVYDPRESGKSEMHADAEGARRDMKGAFVASTTRRTFTKTRAEEVKGQPLLLTWDAMFRGLNDVVHDLSWHEWVIDANRMLRNKALDKAIRPRYGAEVVTQLRTAVKDIAAGENADMDAFSKIMRPLRSRAAIAGLGLNLMNAMLQPLGLTQSMVRIGPKWVAMGVAAWARSPFKLVSDVHELSEFMRNRARTQQREINELQSVVKGESEIRHQLNALMFRPMQAAQMMADMPTWWGAYQKALTQTDDQAKAVKLADQAVLDAQGGGQVKDLARIQRGGEMQKMMTLFYGFFSTSYNLGVERAKATNFRSPLEVMHLAGDFLLLYSVPALLASLLKEALQPGGDDDPEKLARKLAGDQISYLMGTLIGVREITGAVQYATGTKAFDVAYQGPAALRFLQELDKLGKQIGQGDLDRAFARAAVNVGGMAFALPSGQANRTIDGIMALIDGKTENPLAPAFGYNDHR